MQHALGMIPSPADERDYRYPAYGTMIPMAELPLVHVPTTLAPVTNQGAVQRCVAEASMGLREDQECADFGRRLEFSRQFAYHFRPNSYDYQGVGMIPREHLGTLLMYGVPPVELWPGNDERGSQVQPMPFDPVLRAAYAHRIGLYAAVAPSAITEVKSAVYTRGGVLIGVPVYGNFDPDINGYIPSPTGTLLGYHMMRIVGWNTTAWLVANSWGPDWGPGALLPDGSRAPGYCWIRWSFPISEAWTILDTPTISETKILVVENEPIIFINEQARPPVDLAPFLKNDRFCGSFRHIIEALGGEITTWGRYPSTHSRWPGRMYFEGRLVERPWRE